MPWGVRSAPRFIIICGKSWISTDSWPGERLGAIREYLRENIHQYGRLKTSRQILRDMTGEDFDPAYYIRYLKEKYGKIYRVKN